jgi:hypothetical protein
MFEKSGFIWQEFNSKNDGLKKKLFEPSEFGLTKLDCIFIFVLIVQTFK